MPAKNDLRLVVTNSYLACARTADAMGEAHVADAIRRLIDDVTIKQLSDGSFDVFMPSMDDKS